MKQNGIIFKRSLFVQGGSLSLTIPPELVEHLNLKGGDEVCFSGDKSKWGNFVGIWNPEQQKKK